VNSTYIKMHGATIKNCNNTLGRAIKMTCGTQTWRQKNKTHYKQYIHRWTIAWYFTELLTYTVTRETSCMISTHEIITITLKCYKAFLFWYRLDISELWTRVWNSSL